MATLSKLQIRAKVLSVISEIKSLKSYNEDIHKRMVSELEQIEDRNFLFDVFIKEFIKMTENEYMFSSCVIKSLVQADYIQDKVFEILKSTNYSDEAKYKLVQLLRVIGSTSSYDAIPEYFDNPAEILDMETQKLMESAVFNPEAMLDFLDFIYAVPKDDKNLLLTSLKDDYSGDVLANIVYPILYSDFDDDFKLLAIDVLCDTKSSLAIKPFNYLIKISENKEVVTACQLGLKKLKLAGATEEKAQKYFENIVKPYKLASLYTTIPDGNGNQALLISRLNDKGKYAFEAVVINDTYGIVDCFGFFNITQGELVKIINKFYNSEGKYKVSAEYVKFRLNTAIECSIKNKKTIPYEFICWNALMSDIKSDNDLISEKVNNLKTTNKDIKDDVINLLTKEYTLRWFIKTDENEFVNKLVQTIYECDEITIDFVNDNFKNMLDSVFSDEVVSFWKNRLYNLIYLLLENEKEKEAKLFFNMMKNDSLFSLFKSIILQRSVFNSFVILKENQKESLLTVNIFRKKNTQESLYDIKKLDKIISLLKKNWINE